jgi:dolichyl-phosphate beta-glucosyltransferase
MRADDVSPAGTTALVVPCYNEAARLQPARFLEALKTYDWLRLVLVDDGSRDTTRDVLGALASQADGRIEVLALERNSGKAEAVRRGMLRAFELGPQFAGYWDADLSTSFLALPAFQSVFRRLPAIEIVLGSRVRLLGHDIDRTPRRHYIGRVFATGASLALALPVYDTQCGAKVFRVNERTTALFATPFVTRWIFDVEMLARYIDAAAPAEPPPLVDRIYELPLQRWADEPGSKVRAKDGIRAALDLLRIYWIRRH